MERQRYDFWNTVICEHDEALLTFLSKRLNSKADAADVAQEAYLRVIKVAPHEVANPRAYLFTTAAHLAVDHIRHQRAARRKEEDLALVTSVELEARIRQLDFEAEGTLVAKERLDALYQAILDLPPKCRDVFIMHRFRHKTYREIADAVGISRSMVEKYISQALSLCRRRLARMD